MMDNEDTEAESSNHWNWTKFMNKKKADDTNIYLITSLKIIKINIQKIILVSKIINIFIV